MDGDVSTNFGALKSDMDKLKPKIEKSSRHIPVIIIGAGAAGLGAALSLTEAGIECLILEAQNRVGGRIKSLYLDGGCLELGAQWVHGEQGNPLHAFCSKHNLLTDPKTDSSVEGKGIFLLPDGSQLSEHLVEKAISVLDDVKAELATLKEKLPLECEALSCKSVGELYRTRFEEARPTGDDVDAAMNAIMDWYTKFEKVDNACRDINQLSVSGFGQYVECSGAYYINFKDGYESFTRTILRILPNDCVRLSTPVNHVEWSEESEVVRVVTDDGIILSCDHLIVTPSVNVLKEFDFRPPLPAYKLEALDCFGFDTINKLFIYWDNPFWSEDTLGFQLLWPQYDNDFFNVNGDFLRGIYGFEKINNNRNFLLAWVGGDEAEKIESLSDEIVLEGCFQLLQRFASKLFNVTRPSKLFRSAWGSNPYIKGAYSHRILKFDEIPQAVEKLQRPLCSAETKAPLLLFAGEATDVDFFSTIHGAFRSGYREADAIKTYKKKSEPNGNKL